MQALHQKAGNVGLRGGGTTQKRLPSTCMWLRHNFWMRPLVCKSREDDEPREEEGPKERAFNRLSATIKRKQKELEAQLHEMGQEALEERLKSAVQVPAAPAYRLASLIAEAVPTGVAVLVLELARPENTSTTSQELAQMAREFVAAGADALAVRCDSNDTTSGLTDLFCVTQAVGKDVPVIANDWMIHPLQVVEVKQTGAAGVLGIIHQVNGRGTAVMSSFTAAIGLDCPVEVVNAQEVEALARTGVAFYGINLNVGLNLPIPGFSTDIAHGILGELPFGAISMVGVRTLEEARKARLSGADSLFIKKELIDAALAKHGPNRMYAIKQLCDQLSYLTSNDD
ncbi:hypothetical protein DUNSADRAFT_15795 [Dunaliella salina]|uniref:indole-3-glycerol-phosphate synthase n=1 Tax=Dunaliella salina TaxID=3046 RepID=A0ABQ7H1G0_DUNSA|nr:hypothetical protein DUNSADRAFT_15795 [Dunaliella salina]|eukprot:KAF5840700.1 hypothetical protein DUNSADRAFT_15795 [Dunaliella salina]